MKKVKLALSGIAIALAGLLLPVQYNRDDVNRQHSSNAAQDSLQQNNTEAGLPVITIGIPASLY